MRARETCSTACRGTAQRVALTPSLPVAPAHGSRRDERGQIGEGDEEALAGTAKRRDFRQRDPSKSLVGIAVALATILAVALIDKYL
jgi:hypothetical protein